MKIKVDEQLKEYMKEKDCKAIVLYVKHGSSCCGGSFLDVKARLFKEGDEKLILNGYIAMDSDGGKVYYHPEQVIIEGGAKLVYNSLLGMVVIQPIGFRAVDERLCRIIPV